MIDFDYSFLVNLLSPASLPQSAWWVSLATLLILGASALVDAKSGRVPDVYTLTGILLVTAVHGIYMGWEEASNQLLIAISLVLALWLLNEGFYKLFKRDSLGMGDAKWSALAAVTFGVKAVFFAWIIAAWFALLWLMGRKIAAAVSKNKIKKDYVHFAPFLFLGLISALLIMPYAKNIL